MNLPRLGSWATDSFHLSEDNLTLTKPYFQSISDISGLTRLQKGFSPALTPPKVTDYSDKST